MTNHSKLIFLFSILFLSSIALIFSIGKDSIQINRSADSAIFEQVVENIHAGRGAISNVFASTQHFIDKVYFAIPFNEIINTELSQPESSERNILSFHAYWFLFLVAPLITLFDSSLVLSVVHISAYSGLLCCALYTVLKVSQNWLAACLFTLVVAMSPVFVGSLMGQFYPDRLFVLFGFILCYLVYFRVNIFATISVAIFVILLNERAALIGGGIMLLLPFTNTKKNCSVKEISPYLIIGGAMLFYSFLVKTYMLSNQYYDSFLPSTFTDLYSRFSLDTFRDNILTLILVSLPLFLACLGNLKLALLSFFIMFPNIIGNVGGAEKVGWLTHYHSYYFPILVFSGAVGYSEWMSKYKTKTKFLLIFPSVVLSLYIYNTEITSKRLPSIEAQKKSFISFEHLFMGLPTGYDIRSDVESKVQLGKKVVTDELGMALLKNKAEVSLFPLSIKDSDYLFIPCEWTRHDTFNNSALPLQWFEQNDFETKFFERINALDRCFYRKK